MVRNWQSRVEIATARRTISKQKKSKMDQKRQWKSSIQDFQSMIDRIIMNPKLLLINHAAAAKTSSENNDASSPQEKVNKKIWKLHIWTDTAPLSSVSAAAFGTAIEEDEDGEDDPDNDEEYTPCTTHHDRPIHYGNSDVIMEDLLRRR